MGCIPSRIPIRTNTQPTSIHISITIMCMCTTTVTRVQDQTRSQTFRHRLRHPPDAHQTVHPNSGLTPDKSDFSHMSYVKVGLGGFGDETMKMGRSVSVKGIGTEIGSCRERDRRTEIPYPRRQSSSSAMEYERVIPSSLPPSPCHQSQRHETWDDTSVSSLRLLFSPINHATACLAPRVPLNVEPSPAKYSLPL